MLPVIDKDINYIDLARFFSGECSVSEAGKIEEFYKKQPDREALFFQLGFVWETKSRPHIHWNVEVSWTELDHLLEEQTPVTD